MVQTPKIFVNGKEIDPRAMASLPESVRKLLTDANGNGIPDIVEKVIGTPMVQKALASTNLDQLPAPTRELVEKMMTKFGAPSLGPTVPPPRSMDWKALEQPGPKHVPITVVVFAVMAIFALLLVGWIAFWALSRS